jgi:hypothetical protein
MSKKSEKTIPMYDGKVFGIEVSAYGKEKGYLDYRTLAKMLDDCILNNSLRDMTLGVIGTWEIVAGEFDRMIMQDFIISRYGFDILKEYTDEIVFYNEELNIYIWGVTHWGTGWDYELTNVKLIDCD